LESRSESVAGSTEMPAAMMRVLLLERYMGARLRISSKLALKGQSLDVAI
jgi:hypothetical protein